MRAILLADKAIGLISYPGEGNPGSRIFFSAAEFSGRSAILYSGKSIPCVYSLTSCGDKKTFSRMQISNSI